MKKVVIFSGKFQPPHPGHIEAYKFLREKFPEADVFIEATTKVEGRDRPFSCDEKKTMFKLTGVGDEIFCVEMPYQYDVAKSMLNLDLDETILIYAVGEKDMKSDPRFKFGIKRNGKPTYLQPFPENGDFLPASVHGYVFNVPEYSFTIDLPSGASHELSSSTEVRELFRNSNEEEQKHVMRSLYGEYDPVIHQMMSDRLR